MDYRILGMLEVRDDRGAIVDLGTLKQRALLALLLVNANRVVATDRILDELWGDDAFGKENSLWVYISRLRAALEPERTERGRSRVLVTRDHGYQLVVGADELDAVRFARVVADAGGREQDDPEGVASALRDALALWRGDPLEEFPDSTFARLERERLSALRLVALQHRIEADLRLGRSGELVSELEHLLHHHPYHEGFLAQLMLALYQAGRQAEALRTFARYARTVAEDLGINPSPELSRLEEQILLHDIAIRRRLPRLGRTATVPAPNPFKGLQPFSERDAGSFHGRDRLTADVVRRIGAGQRLVSLVGPSGSGKSSLLRAGVIPVLRKGVDTGSGHRSWHVASMVPGAHPMAEFEAALLRSSLDAPDQVTDQLADPETGMLRAALATLTDDESGLVLAIDQFEELFTLADSTARDRFIAGLVTLLDDPQGRITVVLTLRADLYAAPLEYPAFGSRLGDSVINVVPLAIDELEEAALKPADAAGVFLSPSLLTALLTDATGRPGSLPLFQYALTELYERRDGDLLTLEAYRAMGGSDGILGGRADDLFVHLSPAQQEAAEQIFLRLVTIDSDGTRSRRRVQASEFTSLDVDLVHTQAVVEAFAQARMLTIDRDGVTGTPTVELAHEALVDQWERLGRWVADGEQDIRRLAALASAAAEWDESGRDASYLISGSRLAGYRDWADRGRLGLTALQRRFLDESTTADEEARARERERAEQTDRANRKARRRLWALGGATVATATLAITLFVMAFAPSPHSIAVISPSDLGFEDQLIAAGVARAERELPVAIDFRRRVTDLEQEYRDLAAAGTELIFLDPWNAGWDWVEQLIADHPETAFAVVNGNVPPAGALSAYVADEHAGYVAGAAAALTTQTGVVGFVGSRQSISLEQWRAGFEAGATAADPTVHVIATYLGPGGGREEAAGAAGVLYGLGADVVLAAADEASTGVFEAAREATAGDGVHRWAIGSESDWSVEVREDLRPHVLTSTLKRWDVALFGTVEAFVDGSFAPGIRILTFADDAVGLADSTYLTPETTALVDRITGLVADGSISVPRTPTQELIPPGGNAADDQRTVTWDGSECSTTDDPGSPEAGTRVRVEFANESADVREFWVLHDRGTSFDVPVSTLVGPRSTVVGYLDLAPGTFHLNCGPDLRSGVPREPRTAGTLTVP